MSLIFNQLSEEKIKIAKQHQKEIENLYKQWAEEIAKKEAYYKTLSLGSSELMAKYYKTLRQQLQNEVKQIGEATYNNIVGGIQATSYSVVKANLGLMNSLGFDQKYLDAAFSYVPENITQRLITGQIYEGGWNLSKAIWGDDQKTLKDLYTIVARGEAENLPIYDISKDLEKYVNPSRKLDWNPILNRKNTQTGEIVPTRIYKGQVDYNAQRLARTLIQHSYQQSLLEVSEFNPFVTGFIWEANGSNVCEWCDERNGNFYEKGELEMDHPNGMCTFLPVLPSDEDMINELADWYNGEENEGLDNFAKFFGFGGDTATEIAKETGNSVAQTVLDAKVYNDTAKGIKAPAVEVTPVNQLVDQGYNDYIQAHDLMETTNMANFKSLNYVESLSYKDFKDESENLYKLMQSSNAYHHYYIEDAQADLESIIELTKKNAGKYLDNKFNNILGEGIDYLSTKEGMQATRDLYKELLSNAKPETLGKNMFTLESKFMKAVTESGLEANKTEALAKIINGSKSFDDWFNHSTSGTRQELLQAVFENVIPKDFKDVYFIDILSADKESCRLFYNYLVDMVKSDKTMLILLNIDPVTTMVQHASEPIIIKKVTQKSITIKEDMLDKMFVDKGFNKNNMPTFNKWLKTLSDNETNLILQDIGSSAKIGTDQFNKDIGKFLEKYKKILLTDDSVTTTAAVKSETANDLKTLFGMKYEKGNDLANLIDMKLQEDMTKTEYNIALDSLEKKKLKSMLTSFGYKGDLKTMYDNFYNDYLKVFEWVKYENVQKILGYVPKELSQESKSLLFDKYFDKNLYKGKNVKGIYKYDSSLDFIYNKYGVKDVFSSLSDEEIEALLKDAYSVDRKTIQEEILKSYKAQIETFSINNDNQAVKEYISQLIDQKYDYYKSLFKEDYIIFQGKSYDQIAEYLTNAKFKDIDKTIKDAIPTGPIEMETSTYNTILKEYAFNGYDKNNIPSFEEWYVSLKKSDLIQIVDDTYSLSSGKTYQTLTTIEKRALFEKQYVELITKIKNMPDEDFNAVIKKVFKPFAKLGDNYGNLGIGDTANSKVREVIINKQIEEKSLKLSKDFISYYSNLFKDDAFSLNAKYDFNPEEIRKAFLMNEKGMTEKEAIAEVNRQISIKFDNEFLNNWSEEAYNQLRKDNAVFCKSVDESMKKFSDFEKNVWKKLSKEEREALYEYTSGSGKFNKPLRGMENWEDIRTYVGQEFFDNDTSYLYSLAGKYNDGVLAEIKAIERAIDKAITNQDIWLQRGTKSNGAANFLHITKEDILNLSETDLVNKLVGKEITDKGFYSTGAAKGTGFGGNCLFNVYAPKGTKMMYINNHSEFKGENEFILQRNTKFRVTKVEKKGGQLYIDVEVVSQI